MNKFNKYSITLITALVAMTELAYGTQPPDVVNSDSEFNTAMGTNALFSLTSGTANTAAGRDALFSNTGGNENSAFGFEALFSNSTRWQ
jgi:hypothetical protein